MNVVKFRKKTDEGMKSKHNIWNIQKWILCVNNSETNDSNKNDARNDVFEQM